MRPYRGGKRVTASRLDKRALQVTELAIPRDLFGDVDLAFDPAEARDPEGRWADSTLPVKDLLPWRMKSEGLDEEQVKHYMGVIRDRGFPGRVHVEETNQGPLIIDGHHRLEAARRVGVTQVPVRRFANTPEGQLASLKTLNAAERQKTRVDLAFDVHQPRDPHTGRWVQTPGSLARAAVAGGFTVHVEDMAAVKHGFVVARPGTVFLPADNVEVAAEQIHRFLAEHPDVKYLGGWYDNEDHVIHLDVVDMVHDQSEAVRLGRERNQKAVFDLDRMAEIDTGGTGDQHPQAGPDLSTLELGRDDRGRAASMVGEGGTSAGRAREVDLSFNPAQPRNAKGEWALTGREVAALVSWTSKRGGTRRIQKGEAFGDAFTSALSKLPVQPGPVYRGVKGTGAERQAALNVGDVVDWSEPKSVSTDVHKAFAFGTNVYQIDSGSARSLAGRSKFAYEHEAILPPGRFQVTSREMKKVYGAPISVVHLAEIGYSELAVLQADEIDLANPSIGRTRRITRQLLNDEDPVDLLTQRGVYQKTAEAVVKMIDGTVHRPNARLAGHKLTLPIRLERDREALYRGAYLIKAAERVDQAIIEGQSLKDAIANERRFYKAHEEARRNRLEAVTRAQRIAKSYGEPVGNRTLIGWYLNPLLNNDPECVAANGHNFYAEEGTVIGFPGAVHNNCGCVAGPPIEGAGMVNDAVRGVVPITHITSRPKYPVKRKPRMTA